MIRFLFMTMAATGVSALAGGASAQTAQDLVGAWSAVSVESINADGSRKSVFGSDPKTQLIFTSTGQFSQILIRSDLPKFISGNRLTGTPEENAAVVKGSSVAFGTYSVADKVVTLKVEASTFPNWTGTHQPRPVVSFSPDELRWSVAAASGGGRIETVWKRLK